MRAEVSPKTSDGGFVTRRFSPFATEMAVNSYGPVVEGLSGTRIHFPSGVQAMERANGYVHAAMSASLRASPLLAGTISKEFLESPPVNNAIERPSEDHAGLPPIFVKP